MGKRQYKEAKIIHVMAGAKNLLGTKIRGEAPEKDLFKLPSEDDRLLELIINIDNGQIFNWPIGVSAKLEYLVGDDIVTEVMDREFKTLLSLGCVVPEVLDTHNDSFGRFLHFDVDENGYIKDWIVCRKFNNLVWADIKEIEAEIALEKQIGG